MEYETYYEIQILYLENSDKKKKDMEIYNWSQFLVRYKGINLRDKTLHS
jgi:hypothetical protein